MRTDRVVPMPQRAQRPVLSAWRSRLMPLGIAAALFLIVGTLVYQATSSSSKVLAAELTADHEKCFRMNKLLGTHDTAEGVERSMASYGWHMQMPNLDDHQDISVVGSRPCLYGEGNHGAHHVPPERRTGVAVHAEWHAAHERGC